MRAVAEAVWGLLVDDGSLAVGIVAALAVAWIASRALPDEVGWLLLVLLVALVLGNLYVAGRKVRDRA